MNSTDPSQRVRCYCIPGCLRNDYTWPQARCCGRVFSPDVVDDGRVQSIAHGVVPEFDVVHWDSMGTDALHQGLATWAIGCIPTECQAMGCHLFYRAMHPYGMRGFALAPAIGAVLRFAVQNPLVAWDRLVPEC